MKKIVKNAWIAFAAFAAIGCSDDQFDLNYTAPVTITFPGVNSNNIITIAKGVMSQTATISVQAQEGISIFQLYNASATTGDRGDLIQGFEQVFEEGVKQYSTEYTFDNLTDNQCIKVIVLDMEGNSYERNLLAKITPAVVFTETPIMETAEVYYGIYFASWLGGRVYMRNNGAAYAGEIDFSLGEVDLAADGTIKPVILSPAVRGEYGLMNVANVCDTKLELTSLTAVEFDAISKVDASSIEQLTDPTLSIEELKNGVYLFKTSAGKKGLVQVSGLTTKTATIEVAPNQWEKNTAYRELKVTAKVMAW